MTETLEGELPSRLTPVYLEGREGQVKAYGFLGSPENNPPLLRIPEGAKVGDCIGVPIEGRPNLKFFQISKEGREGLIGGWLQEPTVLRDVMIRKLGQGEAMPKVYIPAVGNPEDFKDFISLFKPEWLPGKTIEIYELPTE